MDCGAGEGLVTRSCALKTKQRLQGRGKVAIPGGDTACGDGRGRAWGKLSSGQPESLDWTLQVTGRLRVFIGEGGVTGPDLCGSQSGRGARGASREAG